VQVGSLTTWAAASAGWKSSYGISTGGTLFAWGDNASGQLGQGDQTSRSSPVQVGSLTDWKKVVGFGDTFVAIKTNGTLWTCGEGSAGQLGDSSTVDKSSPVQVGSLTTWSTIKGGGYTLNTAATKTDGTAWAWGQNTVGKLGDGSTTTRSSPVQIGALTDWVGVGVGQEFMLGIRSTDVYDD